MKLKGQQEDYFSIVKNHETTHDKYFQVITFHKYTLMS